MNKMLATISRIDDKLKTIYCELFIKMITVTGRQMILVIKDGMYFLI